MYCVIGMPRTSTTSAWWWINQALGNKSAPYCEVFNEMTDLEVDVTFAKLLDEDPLPVIKCITNNSSYAIEKVFREPRYKTVAILPGDSKAACLKAYIGVSTGDWFGAFKERTRLREDFVGLLKVPQWHLDSWKRNYQYQLEIAKRSDYVFVDKDIISDPNVQYLQKMGLPFTPKAYQYIVYRPHKLDDRSMLEHPEQFDADWNNLWTQD
jgi:hypothetical protein